MLPSPFPAKYNIPTSSSKCGNKIPEVLSTLTDSRADLVFLRSQILNYLSYEAANPVVNPYPVSPNQMNLVDLVPSWHSVYKAVVYDLGSRTYNYLSLVVAPINDPFEFQSIEVKLSLNS